MELDKGLTVGAIFVDFRKGFRQPLSQHPRSLLGPRLYTIYVNDLPDAITLGNVLMYADDTTIHCIGKSFDEVCLKLNKVFDELRLWSLMSKLIIHPIKTEAMILTKQGFIGPAPPPPHPAPILFGDKYVNVVDHTTCLGLTIDNCLSWSKHICHIKKRFSQKVGALKRMRQLPPKN